VNGSAACTACSAGTYNDRLAATTCLSCPSASHSLLGGSDEEADCTCNAGYTGAAGGPCTECAEGKYKGQGAHLSSSPRIFFLLAVPFSFHLSRR